MPHRASAQWRRLLLHLLPRPLLPLPLPSIKVKKTRAPRVNTQIQKRMKKRRLTQKARHASAVRPHMFSKRRRAGGTLDASIPMDVSSLCTLDPIIPTHLQQGRANVCRPKPRIYGSVGTEDIVTESGFGGATYAECSIGRTKCLMAYSSNRYGLDSGKGLRNLPLQVFLLFCIL